MKYTHKMYGLILELENSEESRGLADNTEKMQRQFNSIHNARIDAMLLGLNPPAYAVKKWWVPVWLFAIALRKHWSIFYVRYPR